MEDAKCSLSRPLYTCACYQPSIHPESNCAIKGVRLVPSYTDGSGWLVASFTRAGKAVQVSSHVYVCHYDGPAAEHDVWLSFDFRFARDFVAGVLWFRDQSLNTREMHGFQALMMFGFHGEERSDSFLLDLKKAEQAHKETHRLNVL